MAVVDSREMFIPRRVHSIVLERVPRQRSLRHGCAQEFLGGRARVGRRLAPLPRLPAEHLRVVGPWQSPPLLLVLRDRQPRLVVRHADDVEQRRLRAARALVRLPHERLVSLARGHGDARYAVVQEVLLRKRALLGGGGAVLEQGGRLALDGHAARVVAGARVLQVLVERDDRVSEFAREHLLHQAVVEFRAP